MDKSTANQIHREMRAALDAVAKKHGLQMAAGGNARYTNSSFTLGKVEFGAPNANGIIKDRAYRAFEVNYPHIDMNKKFKLHGRIVRFTGYNSRAGRYPIQYVEVATGRQFKSGRYSIQEAQEA